MTVTASVLLESKVIEATQTTQVTSPNVVTIIDKFTAYNGDAAAQTLSVNMIPPGGTATNPTVTAYKTLQAGETYTFPEIVGHILNKGGSIGTSASKAAVISVRCSGRVIS